MINFDLTKVFIEYKSIIGTLLTSMTTLIVASKIKNIGKIHFYVNNWNGIFYDRDSYGGYCETKDIEKSDRYKFELDFDLFNDSESPKSLRDAYIEFEAKSKLKRFFVKNNVSIKAQVNGLGEPYKIKTINLPPKQMLNMNIYRFVEKEDLLFIRNVERIYFVAKDARNKAYKKLITEVDYFNEGS